MGAPQNLMTTMGASQNLMTTMGAPQNAMHKQKHAHVFSHTAQTDTLRTRVQDILYMSCLIMNSIIILHQDVCVWSNARMHARTDA